MSPKIAKKWGHCWFPVQTMLKRYTNVYTGGVLCSPFLSNFSETPCMKVDFDVRISLLWWMRAVSRRWEIPFSFVFLDFTFTCGEQPFIVIQKAKLLNMTWGDSGKITIIWRNLIHTKLLQTTKESLNGQRPSTLYIYVCIYSFFWLNTIIIIGVATPL